MRVWMDKGECYVRDDAGEIRIVRSPAVEVALNGQRLINCFEADDREGWVLIGQGHMEYTAKGTPIWLFIPDTADPHGVKSEIRRGKVEIRLK